MRSRRLRAFAAAFGFAAVLIFALALVVGSASAFIPKAGRVLNAAAKQNKLAGRAQPLRFELVMRDPAGEPIGRGTLVTHPSGLARLELRGAAGLVERHVLQAGEHLAARGGERLASPREFLPPLFLMQTDSLTSLRTGLSELGADIESIGLSACGESDCYVVGDPARVPPPWEPASSEPVTEAERALAKELLEGGGFADEPVLEVDTADPRLREGPFATLWIDLVSYETKRIDLRSGVVVWVGPPRVWGRVQGPSWLQIDEPGKSQVRFDVLEIAPVEAPAAAFSKSWLYAPVIGPGMGGEDTGAAAENRPEAASGENP